MTRASDRQAPSALSAELLRLSLQAVRREYDHLNGALFEWRLRVPTLAWLEPGAGTQLGRWNPGERRLSLAPRLLDVGWGELLEVVKHEMAHQYVSEVLGVREAPHGPVFRDVCRRRGIDARASGVPERPAASPDSDALAKIRRLLSLAASDNPHEAETAMATAQRLLLKHNLDLALAADDTPSFCYRHLGEPSGRVFEYVRLLALLLHEHFFVQALWVPVWRPRAGKSGSVLEVCGTRENVDLAEYVHDFLLRAAERLWVQHRRTRGLRSNRDRRDYLAGVMTGFRSKLDAQREAHHGQGLVWQGDPALNAYFKSRHPRTSWIRYGGRPTSAARKQGHQDGTHLVLHRGLQSTETSKTRRLLPER